MAAPTCKARLQVQVRGMTSLVMPGNDPASSRPGGEQYRKRPRPVTREPVVVPPGLRSAESRVPRSAGQASASPAPRAGPAPSPALPRPAPAPPAVACRGAAQGGRCGRVSLPDSRLGPQLGGEAEDGSGLIGHYGLSRQHRQPCGGDNDGPGVSEPCGRRSSLSLGSCGRRGVQGVRAAGR